MKVLFLGDIVGKKGREAIRDLLPTLKNKYKPDFIIANGENSAHGKGITINIYNELISYGINVLTLGNHSFSKKEIIDYLDSLDKLICPINHTSKLGKGYRVFEINKEKICVINCLGTVTQEEYTSSPYEAMDEVLNETKKLNIDYYLIDLHAEATAEKRLFLEYYKDKVQAVIGTHTHVQTADEQIISNTGFITDVGMCGPYNSVIGRDIDECIAKTIRKEKTKYTISENKAMLCGLYLELNAHKCIKIERIQIKP